jgi:hypothetical protein
MIAESENVRTRTRSALLYASLYLLLADCRLATVVWENVVRMECMRFALPVRELDMQGETCVR